MEDKKIIYIVSIIIVLALIVLGVIILLFYWQQTSPPAPALTNTDTNRNANVGSLPSSQTISDGAGQAGSGALAELAKEKQFISSFWRATEITYQPQVTPYQLPLAAIKEQVANYRDFSRKIEVDNSLEKLTQNGFVVISDPFRLSTSDWAESYKTIRENELPIFISADAVVGLYQTTLQLIYKEIEEEIFYPSLWQLLTALYQQTKIRYEQRYQQFGIKTDLLTEANRLELSYLAVALKLLQPEQSQVREPLSTQNNKFFTPLEAQNYTVNIPEYLIKEVDAEINLINKKSKDAKSTIFLYQKNYQNFGIPEHYRTSEKLKNYYLTITWLNEGFFPLWSQQNDCSNCLLDDQDHQINFVAALLVSTDLASNQNLKNSWANIYKSISFFKGLETNLTYLDYARALKDSFGNDYTVEQLFDTDSNTAKERLAILQKNIGAFEFPNSLGGTTEYKPETGLRLLRNYHLLENKLFDQLSYQPAGPYLGETKTAPLPFTGCSVHPDFLRCWPTSLDLFNLLGNQTAQTIITANQDDLYQNYQQRLTEFRGELVKFDQNTWHDNAYMSLLSALQKINPSSQGYPSFMANGAWQKKSLTTNLGAWVNFHQEINFEKTDLNETIGLGSYFPYGYVEPQIDFYAELLSNVKMIIEGFNTLQIISPISKSYERLDNLRLALEKLTSIAKKELENSGLDNTDYDFINNFNKHIRAFVGDIKKENIQNNYVLEFSYPQSRTLSEKNQGLNYIIVVYPDSQGQLFFALGPVYRFTEERNNTVSSSGWQNDYQTK